MNWDTDWERAEKYVFWQSSYAPFGRKTFAIRSVLLALLAWSVQWSWLAWWYWTAGRGL